MDILNNPVKNLTVINVGQKEYYLGISIILFICCLFQLLGTIILLTKQKNDQFLALTWNTKNNKWNDRE